MVKRSVFNSIIKSILKRPVPFNIYIKYIFLLIKIYGKYILYQNIVNKF